jgi:hypothetical protein
MTNASAFAAIMYKGSCAVAVPFSSFVLLLAVEAEAAAAVATIARMRRSKFPRW